MKPMHLFLCAVLLCGAATGCRTSADIGQQPGKRIFIAHRGVNMRSTVAGENSLEAIRLAKAAGFEALETDVRRTSDGVLVVMHDSTLNRTCLHADGTPLSEPVTVASTTFEELRTGYVLKATDPARRTRIPTLHEYLTECARNGLYTFIEPKLYDSTGCHYRELIAEADRTLGRGNYVITSNNRANDVIRRIGIDDVRLMDILYQTTFERTQSLGDVIVAVSATRFDEEAYTQQVERAKAAGLMRESHADKFVHFDRINRHDIDFVSTDFLAPDLCGQGTLLAQYTRDDFALPAPAADGAVGLAEGCSIAPVHPLPAIPFGALYLELEGEGAARIELGRETFTATLPAKRSIRHQVLVYDATPALRITALGEGLTLSALRVRAVEFPQ